MVVSQLLGLLERLGVAEVEEVVDAVGIDPDRAVRGHLPLAGDIGGGAVDLGDVPLGLLPVLLLLLRGLRPRLRRLGLRVAGHVRRRGGGGGGGGREASAFGKGKGARARRRGRPVDVYMYVSGSAASLSGGPRRDVVDLDVNLWAQVMPVSFAKVLKRRSCLAR